MQYGLDIGGTKIELAVFDAQLNTVVTQRTRTPTQDYPAFLSAISELVAEADRLASCRGSVGVGLPCIVGDNGKVVSSNIPCINGRSLCRDIRMALGRAVEFANDSETFVLSEALYGAGKGCERVLGAILGTGVNAALCFRGELYGGRNNIAGEWGHMALPALLQQRYQLPLRQCDCGGIGCIEKYISGKGLEWLYHYCGGPDTSAQEMVKAMRAGEGRAREVFSMFIDLLGLGFAQLVLHYDPDVIVVGGGLSNIAEIYGRLPAVMRNYLFAGVAIPQIVPAQFGDSSGVRGAAVIGQRRS